MTKKSGFNNNSTGEVILNRGASGAKVRHPRRDGEPRARVSRHRRRAVSGVSLFWLRPFCPSRCVFFGVDTPVLVGFTGKPRGSHQLVPWERFSTFLSTTRQLVVWVGGFWDLNPWFL